MGKFDKFKGKGNSQRTTTLKVNKYENKEVVLDLISYISTAEAKKSSETFFTQLIDKVKGFDKIQESEHPDYPWIKKNSSDLSFELWCTLTDVIRSLDDNYGSPTVKIAVAGGYSAGKSTFLNYLIENIELLPTGVDPVSIVNTHLTIAPGTNDVVIRGRNLRNGFVGLDKGVLQTIKHSSKSSVHVASVLQSLHIDCPVNDRRLSNVTFVDTPGYNNSTGKNLENDTTDRKTAVSQLNQADAIVWCVDIDKGTIPEDDLNILRDIQTNDSDKPIMVVFTKRHKKKPDSEQKKILLEAKKTLIKGLRKPASLYNVCAFSIDEPVPFLCQKGKDFYNFIDYCKAIRGVSDYKSFVIKEVSRVIANAQREVNTLLSQLESERKETSGKKSDSFRKLEEVRQEINAFIDVIKHYFSTSSQPDFTAVQKNWMRDEITGVYKSKIDLCEDEYESLKDEYKRICESIGDLTKYNEALAQFKIQVISLFEACYTSFIRSVGHDLSKSDPSNSQKYVSDIFSAIAAGNMARFTDCLSEGIALDACNSQGYNPLTYCVAHGRIDMLRYMLENGASCDITDNRGYDPFETAVIVHSKAMCELLLSFNRDLKRTKTSLDDLLKKNTFESWIKTL